MCIDAACLAKVHGFAPREHASSRGPYKQPHLRIATGWPRVALVVAKLGEPFSQRSCHDEMPDTNPAQVPISFASLAKIVLSRLCLSVGFSLSLAQ